MKFEYKIIVNGRIALEIGRGAKNKWELMEKLSIGVHIVNVVCFKKNALTFTDAQLFKLCH